VNFTPLPLVRSVTVTI